MIKVYFESKTHAELAAIFENENVYLTCLPALEALAMERGLIVTEAIEEEPLTYL